MRGQEAAAAIVRFIELFYGRISSLPVPGWLPTASNREMKRQLNIIEDWLSPMIAERKAQEEPSDDVLSLLIEAHGVVKTAIVEPFDRDAQWRGLHVAAFCRKSNLL